MFRKESWGRQQRSSGGKIRAEFCCKSRDILRLLHTNSILNLNNEIFQLDKQPKWQGLLLHEGILKFIETVLKVLQKEEGHVLLSDKGRLKDHHQIIGQIVDAMIEDVMIALQEAEMGLEEEMEVAVAPEMMILVMMTSRRNHSKICESIYAVNFKFNHC